MEDLFAYKPCEDEDYYKILGCDELSTVISAINALVLFDCFFTLLAMSNLAFGKQCCSIRFHYLKQVHFFHRDL